MVCRFDIPSYTSKNRIWIFSTPNQKRTLPQSYSNPFYFVLSTQPKKRPVPNIMHSKTRTKISHICPPPTKNTQQKITPKSPCLGPLLSWKRKPTPQKSLQALVFDLPDELQVNTQLPQLGVCCFPWFLEGQIIQ